MGKLPGGQGGRDRVTQTTSASWQKCSTGLRFQWTPRIGPLKRFGHGLIEVVDEIKDLLFQVIYGGETGAFEQASRQDTKPDLDLIEPRSMLGGIDESDAMRRIGQECGSGRLRLEDARAPLFPQVLVQVTHVNHQRHQRFGLMGVEVIHDEDPGALQIAGHGV